MGNEDGDRHAQYCIINYDGFFIEWQYEGWWLISCFERKLVSGLKNIYRIKKQNF